MRWDASNTEKRPKVFVFLGGRGVKNFQRTRCAVHVIAIAFVLDFFVGCKQQKMLHLILNSFIHSLINDHIPFIEGK